MLTTLTTILFTVLFAWLAGEIVYTARQLNREHWQTRMIDARKNIKLLTRRY